MPNLKPAEFEFRFAVTDEATTTYETVIAQDLPSAVSAIADLHESIALSSVVPV